jgi:hypothetical protein
MIKDSKTLFSIAGSCNGVAGIVAKPGTACSLASNALAEVLNSMRYRMLDADHKNLMTGVAK